MTIHRQKCIWISTTTGHSKSHGKTLISGGFDESCLALTTKIATRSFMFSKTSCQFTRKQQQVKDVKSALSSNASSSKRNWSTISTSWSNSASERTWRPKMISSRRRKLRRTSETSTRPMISAKVMKEIVAQACVREIIWWRLAVCFKRWVWFVWSYRESKFNEVVHRFM